MPTFTQRPLTKHVFGYLFNWSLWYLGTMLISHLIFLWLAGRYDQSIGSFLPFTYYTTTIFMFVAGIFIPYVFLPFKKYGYTRKQIFTSSIKASLLTAVTAIAIIVVITLLQHLIVPELVNPTMADAVIEDSSKSVHIDLSGMNSPLYEALNYSESWVTTILVFFASILVYHFIGLLLGMGYYRYGWVIGFIFIAIALGSFFLFQWIWETDLFSTILLPTVLSVLISLIAAFAAWLLIRNVRIKL
ncbi:hypothetical protein [Bacillus horti]|uniref:MFS family permease n=1 Tax=Caldalkalibacillus horti TaxID=77523 RepID=A0ABT9VZC2_9BACI|nr:hypothetical protein [Bacillus horti]MDQ0166205.1 MFS family permease [Bacillus horti]